MKKYSSRQAKKGKTAFRTPRFFQGRDRHPRINFAKKIRKIKKADLRSHFKFIIPRRFPSRHEGHGKNN
jgi:hypothetical protein